MSGSIGGNERIARCLVFATHFDGDAHTDAALFRFNGDSLPDGSKLESVLWRKYAKADAEVHAYGCRLAEKQNAARGDPSPGPKRRYYCGFREAEAGDLLISEPEYSVTLQHHPEDGEEAHCNLVLRVLVDGKSAKAAARTEAGLIIAQSFGEACSHTCPCDAGDGEHPLVKYGFECLAA